MNDLILLTKKSIGKNKMIKHIQKMNRHKYPLFVKRFPKSKIPKIVNENGFFDLSDKNRNNSYGDMEADLFTNIINSGLKGGSGNGFPVYKKLETFLKTPQSSRKIIVNAVECDPGLIHDEWLLKNKTKEILEGIYAVERLTDTKNVVLAKKQHIAIWNSEIKTVNLPDLYPQGEEHILIKMVFGIDLNKNIIPASEGILIINVQTVLAIGEISNHSYVPGRKYITVADFTTGEAKAARVVVGMKALGVLQAVLGERAGRDKFTGSGVLAGAHIIQENECITDKTSMIAYGKRIEFAPPKACIHCGSCSRNCPMGIPVKHIIGRKKKDINSDVSDLNADSCLKCATCTYQCNAGINVMQAVTASDLNSL